MVRLAVPVVFTLVACAADGGAMGSAAALDGDGSPDVGGDGPPADTGGDGGDPEGVTIATLNVLHGLFCDGCRFEERADLVFEWIARRGCPDLVALQEISRFDGIDWVAAVEARRHDVCPFVYESFVTESLGADEGLFLSRYPVAASKQTFLFEGFRHVLHVRVEHPAGIVDAYTTHLASSSDGAGDPCGPSCPDVCSGAGADTVRRCQAAQLAAIVAESRDPAGLALVTGDMNLEADDPAYGRWISLGWIDLYLAAGNPECDPATGAGCTSGRDDESLDDLESPAPGLDVRVDHVFAVPSEGASVEVDPAATRLFADEPSEPGCGPAPAPICWPSDHAGVQARVLPQK